MNEKLVTVPIERIEKAIFLIRGEKVMLDRDLAPLYGVTTSALKQAVRRSLERFPNDFMFVLDKTEFDDWRSQIVISNADRKGLRHPPIPFTEQGVAMLSSVLRSKRAVLVVSLVLSNNRHQTDTENFFDPFLPVPNLVLRPIFRCWCWACRLWHLRSLG